MAQKRRVSSLAQGASGALLADSPIGRRASMVRRLAVFAAVVVVAAMAAFVSPAAAAKPAGGSFTTTVTVPPTTVTVDGFAVTVSGNLAATVTQFRVDSSGHLVAIATVSGTLTATEPTLGSATITFNTRVVLNANV
ncbi:MAG TPA: hypothetical protein VMR48_04565, partial [Gaiellaceae bacterium]|nr:hypothetical protein [Gaiellaceae bacterium]